jgi:hypothetical protein
MAGDDDNRPAFKGFGVLEWANNIVPQRLLVQGARTTWNLIWKVMRRRRRRRGMMMMMMMMMVMFIMMMMRRRRRRVMLMTWMMMALWPQAMMLELAPQGPDGRYGPSLILYHPLLTHQALYAAPSHWLRVISG